MFHHRIEIFQFFNFWMKNVISFFFLSFYFHLISFLIFWRDENVTFTNEFVAYPKEKKLRKKKKYNE